MRRTMIAATKAHHIGLPPFCFSCPDYPWCNERREVVYQENQIPDKQESGFVNISKIVFLN